MKDQETPKQRKSCDNVVLETSPMTFGSNLEAIGATPLKFQGCDKIDTFKMSPKNIPSQGVELTNPPFCSQHQSLQARLAALEI